MGRCWGSPARRPGWSQRYLGRERRVWGGCSPLGPRRLCTGTCHHRMPWTKVGCLCWPVACPSGACACQCWLPLWSAVYPGSAARSAFVCLCSFPAQQIRWSRGAVSTGSPGCRRQGTYLVWFLFSASRFRWYRCCTEPERSKTHWFVWSRLLLQNHHFQRYRTSPVHPWKSRFWLTFCWVQSAPAREYYIDVLAAPGSDLYTAPWWGR